jgi:hypothetical protein
LVWSPVRFTARPFRCRLVAAVPVGVDVGVAVALVTGVLVPAGVGVDVGVDVGISVGLLVGLGTGVFVGLGVGVFVDAVEPAVTLRVARAVDVPIVNDTMCPPTSADGTVAFTQNPPLRSVWTDGS